jgi:putative tryptophan/tyrosine transport system substrate-binding protein
MVTRRLLMLALAVVPILSMAQQPAKIPRIGVLGLANPNAYAAQLAAFRGGLKDLGYVEGRNIAIEYRWADGHYDRLKELAAELAGLKVDVIVTHGAGSAAAKSVTTTTPIVTYIGDMVAAGLAASLARPGGNVTGTSFLGPELTAKRLELLKEAVPRLAQVASVRNPAGVSSSRMSETINAAARQLKMTLHAYDVKDPAQLEAVFAAMVKDRVGAVVFLDDPMFIANHKAIGDLALKHRLPAIGFTGFAEAGGLMTSGVSLVDLWRRDAYFVDKILKGANPANIPIEQPTKFELVINLKTAKALGLKIPQTLVQRADKVIE